MKDLEKELLAIENEINDIEEEKERNSNIANYLWGLKVIATPYVKKGYVLVYLDKLKSSK